MLVVKLGGGTAINIEQCCDDIAAHWREDARLVVLHGGSDEMTELGGTAGIAGPFRATPERHDQPVYGP